MERIVDVNPGFGKPAFSGVEIRDILLSMAVLSVSFTLIFARSNPRFFDPDPAVNWLCWLGVSALIVATSFMLHELGHKFTAQRFGAWAEYRMFPAGLAACLVMSFFGFLFAAPGAVYIQGRIDREMNGRISIAGPAVNVAVSAVCLALWLMTGGMLHAVLYLFAYLNAFMALFNLLPVPPLDGSKVLAWSLPAYVGSMAAAGALFALTWIL